MSWLATPRATVVAIVLSLVVAAGSLRLGFITDDQAFRAKLHHEPNALDLFRFQSGDPAANAELIRVGRLPWWSAPELKIHFFRPLTGEELAAEDAVFGGAALGYHALGLVWFALLLAGVAVLYRALVSPAAATLGVAVFGLMGAHTEAYAWISARHVLIGTTCAAWALAGYTRLATRWRWGALAPLVLGLAASEAALGAIPIWCAIAWRNGRRRDCILPIAVGIAYLVVYAALGAGTRGSGGYHDPFSDPVGYLGLAIIRLPILLGDAALAIPSGLALFGPAPALVLVGLVAIGIVAWAWGEVDRSLLWLVAGGIAALLPGLAGYPVGRVLVVPDLAFAAVLGAIVARGWKLGPMIVAAAHLIWAPLFGLHEQRALAQRGHVADRAATDVAALVPFHTRAIVIAAASPYVFLYPRGILAETSPGAVSCWSVLSAAASRHRLTRTGEKSFTLEALDRPLLAGSFDTLFRGPGHPFHTGDTFDQCGATIRIARVQDDLPVELAISYQRRLDDPQLTFLAWHAPHLERFAFPPIGASVEL